MKKPWKPAASPVTAAASKPRLGHQHSIRGRISGPIPIHNSMDEDFPMRNPNTGIAQVDDIDLRDQPAAVVEPRQIPGIVQDQITLAQPPRLPSREDEAELTMQDAAATASTPSGPSPASGSAGTRITTQNNNARYSIVSADTSQPKGSKDKLQQQQQQQQQRKKSTLRDALGKLFGRKKRTAAPTNTNGHVENNHGGYGAVGSGDQHRSDVMPRSRPYNTPEPKRIASLPITEYDRALRSHSIGPGDVMAIESARNSLSPDFELSRRRTGTASTHLVGVLRSRDDSMVGLSPRPASTHGRGSTRQSDRVDDPTEIGRAITSDYMGHRRRSRSLSGLVDVVDDQDDVRRRSDEIRYWRESYGPPHVSPPASNVHEEEDDDAQVVEMEVPQDMQEDAQQQQQPQSPIHPFSFGSLTNMNEMAGMKITQAAGIETRIGSLEARVQRLEGVVTQLCNAVPNFRPQIGPSDRVVLQMPDSSHGLNEARDGDGFIRPSNSGHSNYSHLSFGQAPTFIGSVHKSTSQHPPMPHRPVSNATIRGATSLPTLSRDSSGPFTPDHYANLIALIETERSARRVLETQVKNLGHQLNILSKSNNRLTAQYDPPPTAKSFGERSAFDHDDDENYESAMLRKSKTKPRGMTHRTEDSGIATETGDEDEDERSEVFETPVEEMHGYGAFGEHLYEGGRNYDKAARTLSLSQLTLGRKSSGQRPLPPQVI